MAADQDEEGPVPSDEGDPPARGRASRAGQRWAAFRQSPLLPAVVLMFILAASAGLFAGSYTYAMADPTPRYIPAATVGYPDAGPSRAFVDTWEKALGASLELQPYDTFAAARVDVEDQRVFAVLTFRDDDVRLDVASAAGQSVAQVLLSTAPPAARAAGVRLELGDLKPLQPGDPRGLAIFYISLAAVIVGFVGAIQLSVHAPDLEPLERIAAIAGYSALGSFTIAGVVDWLLGALDLPFAESWFILAFTMFTSGMVFTMFNTLVGRWAMLPTWGLMVLLGNPSSGGAVSWPLLPSLLGRIGQWLPPGASVNAQHTAVYFGDAQHAFPFLVLTGWATVSTAVFWVWRDRHPGGREQVEREPSAGDAPAAT